jgi:hypothetical protein
MSSNIWTRCAGASELRPLRLTPWRSVEAQHQVSTRKLVDTLEEQLLLEELINVSKPPDPTHGRLHYLLATPFRYPPLRHGSRFGGRYERGIWYGSETLRTTFAEVAFYRLVFLEGTAAEMDTVSVDLTCFSVRVRTHLGIDLVAPPFEDYRAAIASPDAYGETQALGRSMREAGVEAFRYPSARDREGGINVAILSPSAFAAARPHALQTWHCTTTRYRVELLKRDYLRASSFTFMREEFLVEGALPLPDA